MTEILIKSLKNLLLIDLLRKQNVSEDTRRLVMINTICIFAIIVLSIISPLSILRDNIVVGTLDMVSAVLLIFCIWYLRHSGRLRLPINIGIGVMTLLYLYMFFSGGDSHTGHLWYYTYPLLTLYIMDKKDGLVANAVLLLPAFAYLIWIWPRPDAMYTQAFTIRFIPSIICVFIFTYLFESTRLKTQSRLTSKQVELERTITALRTKELELKAAQDNLERRIRERTAELQASNISLKNQIEERKRAENSRKKLEQQLSRAQKMEALGNLAGGVAHDLNNILSGISSYPELLLLSLSEDNAMYRPLKTIQSSGEKAAAIVQDLLTLSRRGVAVFDTVDLCQVLKEYLSSPEFRKMLSFHHGIIYQTRMPDHPCYIRGSNVHLSKSIMNLITNAAEAMPDGGCIDITIEKIMIDNAQHSLPTLGNGPHYKLTISDEGQGIASEALEHLFEPFFTTKRWDAAAQDLE